MTGVRFDPEHGVPTATTLQAANGAWAEVDLGADESGTRMVRGSDPDLWRHVEDAYALWRQLGEPGWDRFGLTVRSNAADQRIWFESPGGPHTWPLPGGRRRVA